MFVCLRSKNLLFVFLFLINLKEAFLHFEDFCEEKWFFVVVFFIFLFLSKDSLHIKKTNCGFTT